LIDCCLLGNTDLYIFVSGNLKYQMITAKQIHTIPTCQTIILFFSLELDVKC